MVVVVAIVIVVVVTVTVTLSATISGGCMFTGSTGLKCAV